MRNVFVPHASQKADKNMSKAFVSIQILMTTIGCTCAGYYIGEHQYGFAGFWVSIALLAIIPATIVMAKEAQ